MAMRYNERPPVFGQVFAGVTIRDSVQWILAPVVSCPAHDVQVLWYTMVFGVPQSPTTKWLSYNRSRLSIEWERSRQNARATLENGKFSLPDQGPESVNSIQGDAQTTQEHRTGFLDSPSSVLRPFFFHSFTVIRSHWCLGSQFSIFDCLIAHFCSDTRLPSIWGSGPTRRFNCAINCASRQKWSKYQNLEQHKRKGMAQVALPSRSIYLAPEVHGVLTSGYLGSGIISLPPDRGELWGFFLSFFFSWRLPIELSPVLDWQPLLLMSLINLSWLADTNLGGQHLFQALHEGVDTYLEDLVFLTQSNPCVELESHNTTSRLGSFSRFVNIASFGMLNVSGTASGLG